jgi:hypothetical protein
MEACSHARHRKDDRALSAADHAQRAKHMIAAVLHGVAVV